MSEVFSSSIIFYTAIAIGLRLNSKFRGAVNKYYLQDIMKISRIKANRFQHLNDAISAFAKIMISLIADLFLGQFYTILIAYPLYFLLYSTNIFSTIMSGDLKYYLYIITYQIAQMVSDSIFIVFVPFVKFQVKSKQVFDSFLDLWYMFFNITCSGISFFIPMIFKNTVCEKYDIRTLLLFFIPPLAVSSIFFLLFLSYKKNYTIKTVNRSEALTSFKLLFQKDKNLNKEQNANRILKLQSVFTLLSIQAFWFVLADQFETMIIDFTDALYLPNIKLLGGSTLCGASFSSINPITVVLVTPLMLYFIFPRVIPHWSSYRKICFGFFLNQLALCLGLYIHTINIEMDCIDSSLSPHSTWMIIPCVLNACSELITFPIIIKSITTNAPTEYVSLCTCLLWSTNGFASIYCFLINLIRISEVYKCLVFLLSSLVAFPLVYLAFDYDKSISVEEGVKEHEREILNKEIEAEEK